MKSPFDGKVRNYHFGPSRMHESWKVSSSSLRRAVRMFRVGALFPGNYTDKDGLVPVFVRGPNGLEEVLRIPTVGEESDLDESMLNLLGGETEESAGSVTAIALPGAETGLRSAARTELESRSAELERALKDLENKKRELELSSRLLSAELSRRMEQIWVIELYLGSKEEVTVLRMGTPAPESTPIAVRQSLLCMDEEIAVHDGLLSPTSVGEFDYVDLERFDRWLVENPAGLDLICPWQKGVVGLRVRRHRKDRAPAADISAAIYRDEQEAWDRMTYLLIRNGEQLFRLWLDVDLWPRLFPSVADGDAAAGIQNNDIRDTFRQRDAKATMKHQIAGLIAIQGILDRSELLHPIPKGLSVFGRDQSGFLMVRDGEESLSLTDDSDDLSRIQWEDTKVYDSKTFASTVTQKGYHSWLQEQLGVGVRVLYTGGRRNSEHDKLEERTGLRTIGCWPSDSEVYTITEHNSVKSHYAGPFTFKYLPKQTIYSGSAWGEFEERERTRRVSFTCWDSEVLPVDFISWRVLEHLIRDRSQRSHYGTFFKAAFHWWRFAKAEAERERPFIDLVMVRCGVDLTNEAERARCERVLRWWKIKTKENRSLGVDEAKALRMVEKAFRKGEDHENDPEFLLFHAK